MSGDKGSTSTTSNNNETGSRTELVPTATGETTTNDTVRDGTPHPNGNNDSTPSSTSTTTNNKRTFTQAELQQQFDAMFAEALAKSAAQASQNASLQGSPPSKKRRMSSLSQFGTTDGNIPTTTNRRRHKNSSNSRNTNKTGSNSDKKKNKKHKKKNKDSSSKSRSKARRHRSSQQKDKPLPPSVCSKLAASIFWCFSSSAGSSGVWWCLVYLFTVCPTCL